MLYTTSLGDKEIPWVNAILIAMSAGLIGIGVYAWSQKSWSVLSCALLIALAAALAGAIVGFIFGIPKSAATATSTTASGTVTATSEYQGNSNLEQISDWLTKILVGASLVQLGEIRAEFDKFGSRLDASGSMGTAGWIAGPAIVIAYFVAGFLLAYLWARIYMARALTGEDGRAAKATADSSGAQATSP
ncbi:MAG TPA: hypothetical protein VEK79_02060 [Thermoanaerobaculia bacterium]|nr:hypothetical protein [Thermoanaerobaculia bacterium]